MMMLRQRGGAEGTLTYTIHYRNASCGERSELHLLH